MSSPLLILTSDPAVVRDAATARTGSPPSVFRDAASLAKHLATSPAPLALVDLEPDPRGMLVALSSLSMQFPDTRFVVLCRELNAESLLAAMQSGARHGVRRDALAADLPAVFQTLLREGTPAASGQVVTVLSSSGGCGCTTLAVALAEELRQSGAGPVLLIDLDVHYGAAASYLGLTGTYGVSDVLGRAGTIDAQLVSSSARAYGDDFHVLLSPAAVNAADPAPLDWRRLPELLEAARAFAPFTVVDAARVPPTAAADLARASALTLLVMELAVVDIRAARALLQGLDDRGVVSADVLPVVNRFTRKQTAPSLQDARDALGREAATVVNDFPSALRALNHGEPVPRSAPRSELREDVRKLAARILPRQVAALSSKGR